MDADGEVGTLFQEMWDFEQRRAERLPLGEPRLEPRKGLDAELEQVGLRGAVEGVENISDGDTKRDEVDQLVLDQRTEQIPGHGELSRGVV